MTFDQLVTEVKDRLNLSSTDATTRIGRTINRKYRLVTTSIGLQLSRRVTVQADVTIGVSTLIFTNTEKVINVSNRASSPYRMLTEVTIDELEAEQPFSLSDGPTTYAVSSHTSDTVTILLNRTPQTAFTLYADVHQAVSDLSGASEPAFPESFHDILIEGTISDELRKMEKPALAAIAQKEYERILSDLKMWIAKSGYLDIYPTKTAHITLGGSTGSGGGGSSSVNGASSYTQTGLITFDRDPSAPFAVTAGSAVVPNLDADLLDGQSGAAYHDSSLLTGTIAALSGVNLTALNATNLASGTVAVARHSAGVTTVLILTTTGTQNNWAPGLSGNTYINWSSASALNVTGFAGGVSGQMITFCNTGGGALVTFAHQSASSSAGNKLFNTATSAVTPVSVGGYATWIYNTGDWVLVAHEQGAWITPAFNAAHFTGAASMTWTVDSGDVARSRYRLRGRDLTYSFAVAVTTVGGTPAAALQITNGQWGGFTLNGADYVAAAYANDNGTPVEAYVAGGSTLLQIVKTTGVAWSASTNATYIYATFTGEVN